MGRNATLALRRKLANFGHRIECEVVSLVDHPHELVDTYGRGVVANIRVGSNFDADINLWLAEEAWVVPTFDTSMTREEIDALLEAMRKGQRKGRVGGAVTGDTTKFDKNLLIAARGAAGRQRAAADAPSCPPPGRLSDAEQAGVVAGPSNRSWCARPTPASSSSTSST